MSEHVSTIEPDDDGWYDINCSCGFTFGPVPGAETAADVWGDHCVEAHTALLRRVLSEYVAGNRIVDGYWYSPDETGEAHNINDRATADELALVESLRTEAGL